MAVEADRGLLVEEVRLRLEVVEDVAEVLGVVHRRVDQRHAHLGVREREVPEPVYLVDGKLLARPLHDGRGRGVEVVEVLPRRDVEVVVSNDDRTSDRADYVHALVRAGVVPHDVAGAEEVRDPLRAAVVKHDVQRVEIGVYIPQDCE